MTPFVIRFVVIILSGYSHTGAIIRGGELYMWESAAVEKGRIDDIAETIGCYSAISTNLMIGYDHMKIIKSSCGSQHTDIDCY